MIRRWTLWENEEGQALRLSLALLNDWWEPQREITKECGPFHDVDERRLELHDDMRRWLALYGWQDELNLG